MLTKQDLIDGMADEIGVRKVEAERAVDWLFDRVGGELAEGGELKLRGFGRLLAVDSAARIANNPRTGEKVTVAARRTARFKPGKALALRMNP